MVNVTYRARVLEGDERMQWGADIEDRVIITSFSRAPVIRGSLSASRSPWAVMHGGPALH